MGKNNIVKKEQPPKKRKKVRLNNPTTNSSITKAMFDRECAEFDAGLLKEEHELYLGERV